MHIPYDTCIVTWSISQESGFWEKVTSLGHLTDDTQSEQSEENERRAYLLGPAVDQAGGSSAAILACAKSKTDDDLSCVLSLFPPPTSDPPDEVVAESSKLGGKVGLASLIESQFVNLPLPAATYRVTVSVPVKDGRRCTLLSIAPEPVDSLLAIAETATLEEIGYRFENGVLGIRELGVVYDHIKKVYTIKIRAEGILKVDKSLGLPLANDLAEFVTGQLFEAAKTK